MFTKTIKRRIKKLLCYTSILSLVLSMAGKTYGEDLLGEKVPIKQVTAGERFTAVLDENGQAWGWGSNNFGQLGYGSYASSDYKTEPVAVNQQEGIKFTQIAAGAYHTVA